MVTIHRQNLTLFNNFLSGDCDSTETSQEFKTLLMGSDGSESYYSQLNLIFKAVLSKVVMFSLESKYSKKILLFCHQSYSSSGMGIVDHDQVKGISFSISRASQCEEGGG